MVSWLVRESVAVGVRGLGMVSWLVCESEAWWCRGWCARVRHGVVVGVRECGMLCKDTENLIPLSLSPRAQRPRTQTI